MFVNETRRIVDCIVDDEVEVLFRRVVCDLGVGDFFSCRHFLWGFGLRSRVLGWYLEMDGRGSGNKQRVR